MDNFTPYLGCKSPGIGSKVAFSQITIKAKGLAIYQSF